MKSTYLEINNMKYDLAEWVLEAREKSGLSQEKFALMLDYSGKGTVSAWEKGKNMPPFDVMVRISEMFNQPLPYIEPSQLGSIEEDDVIEFQQFDIAASCGNGIFNTDYPELIRSLKIPKNQIKNLLGKINTQGLMLLSIPTDSMEPTIPKKSIIFVDTRITDYEYEGVYAFIVNGATYVKRLQMIPTNTSHKFVAKSDNKTYDNFEITPENCDDFRIIAKFVAVLPLEIYEL